MLNSFGNESMTLNDIIRSIPDYTIISQRVSQTMVNSNPDSNLPMHGIMTITKQSEWYITILYITNGSELYIWGGNQESADKGIQLRKI